jgi:hypothetical protein
MRGGSTQAAQVGIAAGFSVQPEATTLYPFLATPLVSTPATINSFVNAVFMNLFGHPQATGATYWPTQLQNTLTAAAALSGVAQTNFIANAVGQFIYDIALGAQAADQAVLTAKVTVANYFTLDTQTYNVATPVGSPAWTEAKAVVSGVTLLTQVPAAEAAIDAFFAAGTPGQTFTLTTGIDVLPGAAMIGSLGTTDTSGNDIIVGQNTGAAATWTMNPGDQLNAGGGTFNQLKLFSGGTAAEVAQTQFPTLTNFQGLWINHFGGHTLDVTTNQFPNLSAVQLDNVNGGGAAVTANLIVSHDAVTFSNDTTGGNTYQLSSVADTSENVTLSAVGTFGAHSVLNAAFDNGTQHSHTVTGLTISSTGGPNFVDYGSDAANPLFTVTFAHSATGDTNWTGNNNGSSHSEVIDASAFTAQWIGGTPGGATASLPFGTANTAATGFGDSGSVFGDTIKLGSGASFLAENAVGNGNTGDAVTLLAGHTALNVIDTTADWGPTYTTSTNEIAAMNTITNFNLGNNTVGSGDLLKMGITTHPVAVGSATDIGGGFTNVTGQAGFVTGGTAAAFEAAVWNAETSGTPASGDVIAYTDGVNTYVAYFDITAGANGNSHITELVGVHTAAALSLTGGATGQIHIA